MWHKGVVSTVTVALIQFSCAPYSSLLSPAPSKSNSVGAAFSSLGWHGKKRIPNPNVYLRLRASDEGDVGFRIGYFEGFCLDYKHVLLDSDPFFVSGDLALGVPSLAICPSILLGTENVYGGVKILYPLAEDGPGEPLASLTFGITSGGDVRFIAELTFINELNRINERELGLAGITSGMVNFVVGIQFGLNSATK